MAPKRNMLSYGQAVQRRQGLLAFGAFFAVVVVYLAANPELFPEDTPIRDFMGRVNSVFTLLLGGPLVLVAGEGHPCGGRRHGSRLPQPGSSSLQPPSDSSRAICMHVAAATAAGKLLLVVGLGFGLKLIQKKLQAPKERIKERQAAGMRQGQQAWVLQAQQHSNAAVATRARESAAEEAYRKARQAAVAEDAATKERQAAGMRQGQQARVLQAQQQYNAAAAVEQAGRSR